MYEPTSETQASPIIDVTGDSTFEIIESLNANGEPQATPVWIVGNDALGLNPFKISLRRTQADGLNINVLGGKQFNLLDTPLVELINEDNLVYTVSGTGLNRVIKFPYVSDRVHITTKLRVTGTIAGSLNTQRTWEYQIKRQNDEVLEIKQSFKFDGNSINRQTIDFESFVRGANDPFITDGIKLILNNLSTQTITINSIQFTTELFY